MPHPILRHGGLPFVHTRKRWFRAQSENLLQFVPNNADDLTVGEMPDVFGIRACEEATQKASVGRRTVRELVMHERRCQQLLAFAARNQESKSRRKRAANFVVISKPHSD